LVELRAEGHSGHGECHPLRRFGESLGSARRALERAGGLLGEDPLAEDALGQVRAEIQGELAAKCALDAALHDLRGKLLGQPVWRMLGLERSGPPTSHTIWLDKPEAMARAARRAGARASRLKLKLAGDGLDWERVSAVREATDRPLIVDVNEGWTLEQALDLIPRLASLGVGLVEQPLPAIHPDGARVKADSPIPIYVDEDCRTPEDLAACALRAHGVNVKLAKCGGITPALRLAEDARELGLGLMLGCMVESSLGIAAACQVASLFDHADLDGNLLLTDDPWEGVDLVDHRQLPADEPGLGVRRRETVG
jgi:L-alanine-DL-glutamate epimerase-like enolase superfamily enzyme